MNRNDLDKVMLDGDLPASDNRNVAGPFIPTSTVQWMLATTSLLVQSRRVAVRSMEAVGQAFNNRF